MTAPLLCGRRACTSPSPPGAATPPGAGRRRRGPRHPARRDRRAGRRVGLRQDDPGALAARPRPADGRPRHLRGPPARTTPPALSRRTASASSWSSRTRAARSTPGTRCTTRWRRGCASTGTGATSARRSSTALSRAGLRPPERFFLRYPHELSGGQRQRVVIAGALVLEPELIVADEPVASLDASVRGEILALLLRLRSELGLSALVVTHDLGLAWNIADRVAVMYLGRIVETGAVEEVLTAPQHPYTQALLSVLPGGSRRPGRPHRRAPGPLPHPRAAAASTPAARSWRAARRNARASRTRAAGRTCRCWTGRGGAQVACHWARRCGRGVTARGHDGAAPRTTHRPRAYQRAAVARVRR